MFKKIIAAMAAVSGLSFGIKNDKIVSITAYMDQ
jgi:hypothetical protein